MAVKGWGFMLSYATDGSIFVGRPNTISVSSDVSVTDRKGYPFDNAGGTLQTVDSFIAEETYSLQLGTESFDEVVVSQMMDQKISTVTSLVLPVARQITVPATTPFEVANADLTVDQQVGVENIADVNPTQFTQVTTAPAAANTFQIVAGKIIFHSSAAGRTMVMNYFKTHSNVRTIGRNSSPIGDLGFVGRLIGPRFNPAPLIHIPKMTRISGISLGGETANITYRPTLAAGYALPVIIAYGVAA